MQDACHFGLKADIGVTPLTATDCPCSTAGYWHIGHIAFLHTLDTQLHPGQRFAPLIWDGFSTFREMDQAYPNQKLTHFQAR